MPGDRLGTPLAQIALFPNNYLVFLCCSHWTVTQGVAEAGVDSTGRGDGVPALGADASLGQQQVMPALVAVLLQQESGEEC